MNLLNRLQQTLQYLYRVDSPVEANDFQLHPEHLSLLLGEPNKERPREALYLIPGADQTTDIGLYICPHEVRRAEKFIDAPKTGSVDSFCVALEGVSHFLYLTYCSAALQRPVSQLELELQAEVDKYLLLRILFGVRDAMSRLFASLHLHPSVTPDSEERYIVAHNNASRYVRWMDSQIAHGDFYRVVEDARAFYRKTITAKLAHIDCM